MNIPDKVAPVPETYKLINALSPKYIKAAFKERVPKICDYHKNAGVDFEGNYFIHVLFGKTTFYSQEDSKSLRAGSFIHINGRFHMLTSDKTRILMLPLVSPVRTYRHKIMDNLPYDTRPEGIKLKSLLQYLDLTLDDNIGYEVVEMSPYQKIPLRMHQHSTAIVLITDGFGFCTIDSVSNKLDTGNIIYISAKAWHTFTASGKGMRFISIQSSPNEDDYVFHQ